MESLSILLMEDERKKKQKVTTFKLTEDLTRALDVITDRDGCTKAAAIRRMIMLGLETDTEIQELKQHAKNRVAAREWQSQKKSSGKLQAG